MQVQFLHSLNISWNTFLYGSGKTVSPIKLFGVSKPLVCFLSRIRLSWGISYCSSSVLQLYCEANGNTTSFSQNVGLQGTKACITCIMNQYSLENLFLTSEISISIIGMNEPVLLCVDLSFNYWSAYVIPFKPRAWCDLMAWRCSTNVALLGEGSQHSPTRH